MMSRVRGGVLSGCLLLAACGGEPPQGDGAEVPTPVTQNRVGNQPPTVVDVTLEPRAPRPGERITARAEVRDPEGDPTTVEYRWRIAGREVASRGPSILVENARRGDAIQVSAVARDASGESLPENAYAEVGNIPPRIVQVVMQPLGEVNASSDVTASPRASDPEGDAIEFHYRWRVNGSDVGGSSPTLTADHFKRGDRIELEVTASDGYDTSEPLRSAPIEVVNAPPRITSTPGAIGPDGVLRYPMQAEDPDGDRVFRYRLVEGPGGMTVGFSDGLLTWSPGPQDGGRHNVEVSVEDGFGASTTQRFSIDVSFQDVATTPESGEDATDPAALAEADAEEDEAPPAAPED
jgi:hypothetical protein